MGKVPEAYFMFNTAPTPPFLMRAPPAIFGKCSYLASRPESDEKVAAGVEMKLQLAQLLASRRRRLKHQIQVPRWDLEVLKFGLWLHLQI